MIVVMMMMMMTTTTMMLMSPGDDYCNNGILMTAMSILDGPANLQ